MRRQRQGGFSLLEVLVATFIMAVAVVALLSNLTTSLRNASNLTDHDRVALLARHKMDELLLLPKFPPGQVVEGVFSPAETAGLEAQWRARAMVFEFLPGAGPGSEILERVELHIVVHRNGKSKPFALEAFRRRFLQPDEPPPVPFAGQPL